MFEFFVAQAIVRDVYHKLDNNVMTSGSMCALIQAYFSVVCLDRHNKIQLYDKSNLDNGM